MQQPTEPPSVDTMVDFVRGVRARTRLLAAPGYAQIIRSEIATLLGHQSLPEFMRVECTQLLQEVEALHLHLGFHV
jgi:hypothetical protein